MAPADLASRAVPVVRKGMTLVDPAGPVGMIPVDPAGPAGMILVDPEGRLGAPNPVGLVGMILVAPNRVARVEPGNRAATDLRMGRAPLGRMPVRPVRMPTRLHLTAARPLLMPALPHLTRGDRRTPPDRRRDPTTRAVAACQVAIRAVATRAVAIRRAEATRKSRHVC
jgi:hypothetical protein